MESSAAPERLTCISVLGNALPSVVAGSMKPAARCRTCGQRIVDAQVEGETLDRGEIQADIGQTSLDPRIPRSQAMH